jgi:hypothetical protein
MWEVRKACKRQWEQTRYPGHKRSNNQASRELREAVQKEREEALGDELAVLEVKEGFLWKKTRMLTKRCEAIPPLKEGRHNVIGR